MKNKFKIYLRLSFLFYFIHISSTTKSQEIGLYVSPKGNDQQAGTKALPLKTLEGAKMAVRQAKKKYPNQPVTVYFEDGTYPMEQTVYFTIEDSGSETAPVTYRSLNGNTVFTGNQRLTKWELLKDQKALDLLPSPARGKVWVVNLSALGIKDYGDASTVGSRPELYCNDQPQTLARWPNEGYSNAGKALVSSYSFEYLDTYQDRWSVESDIRICGYWQYDWCNEYLKIDHWHAGSRKARLRTMHYYGMRDGFRYFGANLFCEIDQPGEWYLNRSTGLLYWYPPKGTSPVVAQSYLSTFSQPFMVSMAVCSHVSFEGLNFMGGRGSAILIDNCTDVQVNGCRIEQFGKDAINVWGASSRNHSITGCYLLTLGGSGIRIEGGDRKTLTPANHVIEHNIIERFALSRLTAETAIFASGCGMRIAHNRFQFSPSSAMSLSGNDYLVEYNQFFQLVTESDDQGGIDIYYNPSFRGNVFRHNYWGDIRGGGQDFVAAAVRLDDMISGTVIYGNIFERCGHSFFGAVQINGGKENSIENNIMYQCNAAASFTAWEEKRWTSELELPEMQLKLFGEVNIFSDVYLSKYPELRDLYKNINVNTVKDNLILECDRAFMGDPDKQKMSNNPVFNNVSGDNSFCLQTIQKQYNLQSIPLENIGPKNNKWLGSSYDPMSSSTFKNLRQTCSEKKTSSILAADANVSIYPNPASEYLNIYSEEGVKQIDIIDVSGKVILTNGQMTSTYVSLSGVPSGVYVVRITTDSGDLHNIKLVK